MNKRICLIILLLTCRICVAQTPSWIWAKSAGSVNVDYGNAVCSDASGNIYVTGTFQGSSITFGSYTLYNSATSTLDIFVVKYDASGIVLWAASGGGTNNDYAYGICADANGNVYITGYFRSSSIAFDTITLTNVSMYSNENDFFLTKYDSNGNLIWAKSSNGKRNDMSLGICTDSNNNVYITGRFYSDTIFFGNLTMINTSSGTGSGNSDVFIIKYNSGGNAIWVKNGGGMDSDYGNCIGSDANNNIYVGGHISNSAVFGNDTINGNGYTLFITKYDAFGNVFWAKGVVGIGLSAVFCTGIAIDSGGNIYATGAFQNSAIFGNDTLGNINNSSVFIAKYNSSGNALWARNPGGTGNDFGTSICTNINGDVFVTGLFGSSFLNFGGIPLINTNVGYEDAFIVEYDANGNSVWATDLGGQDREYGMGICSNPLGDVYTTGYFGSYSLDFGNHTIFSSGSYDMYTAKLGFPTGIVESNLSGWNVFPNPFNDKLNIQTLQNEQSEIILYDITARKLLQQSFMNSISINTEQLAKGIYLFEVRNKNGVIKQGKVVKD